MSLNKSIEFGKEKRKPWRGRNKSKNFDCTCRNHGSCLYCQNNRLYNYQKNLQEASEKIKEWEEQEETDINKIYRVTYQLILSNGKEFLSIEDLIFCPTKEDLDDIGYQIIDQFKQDTYFKIISIKEISV